MSLGGLKYTIFESSIPPERGDRLFAHSDNFPVYLDKKVLEEELVPKMA